MRQEQKDFFFLLQSSMHLSPSGWLKGSKTGSQVAELLCRDEVDDHVDDAGAAGAAAQVHARVPDFILQQLVQLPTQLLHQLSHLGNTQNLQSQVHLCTYTHFVHF